jgi:uncharacterized protein YndB with AHSA1/START domain
METMLDKADVTLPSDREVEVRRSFKAPRALVYRAYSEPALLRRWMLGPPGWTMPVCEMDLRVGGSYRWRWRSDTDNSEFGFSGVFREVDPPSRVVHTQVFDPGTTATGDAGEEAVVTVTMAEERGVTTVTTRIDFGSKAGRDAAMASGMTGGMEQSYQLLDRTLAELAAS